MKPKRKLWVPASLAVLAVACLWLFALKPKRPPTAFTSSSSHARLDVGVSLASAPTDEGSISGFVRSGAGKALKDARVCATTVSSEIFWTPHVTCAATDPAGRYQIAPLAGTAYVVSAAADGFVPASAELGGNVVLGRAEAKTGVDIVLQAGGAQLSGRVLDATGGPISGATIRVLRQALPHDTAVASSGPDGRFAMWIAQGRVTVLAEAGDYAPVRMVHVAPSSDLVLTLTPGSSISGRVIADVTGAPVAGVVVRAVQSHSWNSPTQPTGTSNLEGIFEIHGLEPNAYVLVGEGEGWRGERRLPLSIGLAQHVDGVTLNVSAAAVVTGTVVRRGSTTPCSRGTVILGPDTLPAQPPAPPPGPPPPRTPTILGNVQADGTVRFAAVPAGKYRVNVRCIDFLPSGGPTTLEVGRSDLNGLVWQVDPGVRLIVRAVNELDQPAANAHLWLSSDPADKDQKRAPYHSPFITDAKGEHELTGLPPGRYIVEPDRGWQGQPVAVDARNSEKVDATIRLLGAASILVTVRAPDGTAVDRVEVSTSSGGIPGMALGNGRFQIGPLAAGAYRVQVSDGVNPPAEPMDWPQGIVRVRAGVTPATVILRRTGNIRGRVVDGSGQALPDLWVSANCSLRSGDSDPSNMVVKAPSRPGHSARVMSDSDGRFRIDGLGEDTSCVVRAEQPGGGKGVATKVHPGDEIVVTLAALGSLKGTARLPDGSPAASFTLSVRDPKTGVARNDIVSAVDGRWSLAAVAPGHLLVSAFEPTAGVAEARLELAPGEQRDGIELQFRPPRSSKPNSNQPNQ